MLDMLKKIIVASQECKNDGPFVARLYVCGDIIYYSYHFCVYLKIFMIKSIFRNRKEERFYRNILAKVTNDFFVAEHNEHVALSLRSLATVSSNS